MIKFILMSVWIFVVAYVAAFVLKDKISLSAEVQSQYAQLCMKAAQERGVDASSFKHAYVSRETSGGVLVKLQESFDLLGRHATCSVKGGPIDGEISMFLR